jgi:N4-gp56 family major capsid protein
LSLANFIPQEWSAQILENLNDKHVYAQLANTDHEGEIKGFGDSVRINSVGRVAISSYTRNSTSLSFENVDGAGQVLVIDQSNYFAFEIDDLDKAQTKPKLMQAYTTEAAWGLSDTADAQIASNLTAGVATANTLTAATSVGVGDSDDDAYQLLVDLDTRLTINNVPGSGRWVVIPPWFLGVLRKDPRFVSFGTDGNRTTLLNGEIGQVANMTVHISNNVPVSGSDYTVIAGHAIASSFAEQISEVEGLRPEAAFSDALKGLHLWGHKVTRPTALAEVVATAA